MTIISGMTDTSTKKSTPTREKYLAWRADALTDACWHCRNHGWLDRCLELVALLEEQREDREDLQEALRRLQQEPETIPWEPEEEK